MSAKGISPKARASKGGPSFEPRNTPATQAQLTYREVQNVMLTDYARWLIVGLPLGSASG